MENLRWKYGIKQTTMKVWWLSGSTIGICCVPMYAYFYWHTDDFEHAYINMYNLHSFFSIIFRVFNFCFFFLVFIILYCLKTYCYMCELLFICLWKRQILYSLHLFNRNPIFQFLIQIIYSLPQSTCQFRVSVRK